MLSKYRHDNVGGDGDVSSKILSGSKRRLEMLRAHDKLIIEEKQKEGDRKEPTFIKR